MVIKVDKRINPHLNITRTISRQVCSFACHGSWGIGSEYLWSYSKTASPKVTTSLREKGWSREKRTQPWYNIVGFKDNTTWLPLHFPFQYRAQIVCPEIKGQCVSPHFCTAFSQEHKICSWSKKKKKKCI